MLTFSKISAASILFVALTFDALGATCPSTVYYPNGNYMKSGSTYYYPKGNYAISGSTVYYPNGNYMKSGSTLYYPNGNYLLSGSTWYYPNGNYLRSGSTYYYTNGNYLKSGSTFYHRNGNYARSGSTVYREDGSITQFSVTLSEAIDAYGTFSFFVDSTSERFDISDITLFQELATNGKLIFDGSSFGARIDFNSGRPGEDLFVKISADGVVDCQAAAPAPMEFSVYSGAADVQVRVKTGYDPVRVREALQRALDAL